MRQTIYIDILILINLLINYLLLLTVRGFLHVRVGRGRVFLGAFAGALGSLVILLPQPHWAAGLLYRLGLSGIMVLACFFPVSCRLFAKLLGLLYLASFGFAGFMLALWAMGQNSQLLMHNGVMYLPVSPALLLILAAAAYLMMKLLRRITGSGEPKSHFCTVVVENRGKRVTLMGKIDTGSTLSEPFSNRPVIVMEKSSVSPVLPSCLLGSGETAGWQEGVRMIPCQGVEGKRILPGFVPERLVVAADGEEKELDGCWIAVCSQKIGGGQFAALVPPAIFD